MSNIIQMVDNYIPTTVKVVGDVTAAGVAVAAWAEWLTPVAAIFSIIWVVMQIVMNWSRLIREIRGWFSTKDKK